ncbi:hypothetical protein Tco_1056370 [Tanacetum coccineum]|uniref:Uncharacterized protein n=1 Tax=Tanacetum coccineum TaxID=301880 RepID=A0ABQ5H4M9_9ASTR
MVSATKDPLKFNNLMATPIDFSKYVLNGLKIENLTQDILLGHAFNLLKGTCSSSIELEYNFQECLNALTDKISWNNLEGDRYLFDLSKHLPLQGPLGHRTVAADYFFNNDLEYLKTSDPEVTYTSSITKTKAARYEIKGIKDMVPTLWSTIKHAYDKDAEKGIKHWGERRKLWYRSQVSKFSKHNVYSTKAILSVKSVSVKKLHGYGHLEEIVVKRSDQQLYKFKEGDFVDLHLNDIEDMLLLAVQHKLFHLDGSVIIDVIVALQIEFKEPYTPSYDPLGIVYKDLNKQKRVLRADKLYKFLDGTLKSVRDEIHYRLIDKQLREKEIIKNLERLIGAQELEMDYKLMTRHHSNTKVFTMTIEILPEPTSNKLRGSTTGVTTASIPVTTATTASPKRPVNDSITDDITLAETLMKIKSSTSTPQKAKGVVVKGSSEPTVTSRPQPQIPAKDKGKGIMQEPEKPVKVKGKDKIAFDEEVAQRLEAQMQAKFEEEKRLMDKRKKHFAKLRAEEIRRKPPTKAQKRNQMCTYLKNMANYKHSQLKNKSFEEIQMLFDNNMKWVDSFVPMDSEVVEGSKSQTEGSKKRTRKELDKESFKRQKLEDDARKGKT